MPNKTTEVETNSTPNSIKEVQLKALTFQELWDHYPSGDPYDNPAYRDQCAIRMSVTFHRVGVEMKSFSQRWVKPLSGQSSIGRIMLDGKATATRAGESVGTASGGHIDLWNGSRLTISGFFDGVATIGRYVGIQSFRQGATVASEVSYSDLRGSKSILFWEIK